MPQPYIFNETQTFVNKLSLLPTSKPVNPEHLLNFLLTRSFAQAECQSSTLSQQKTKLQRQIQLLKNKISERVQKNEMIVSLLMKRDTKTAQLQNFVKQSDRIQVKLKIQEVRQKYKPKRLESEAKKILFMDKKKLLKDNYNYYKVQNRQLQAKILEIRRHVEHLQRQSAILFQQKQSVQVIESLKPTSKLSIFKENQHICLNSNGRILQQENPWVRKIQQIKKRHLSPQRQQYHQQVYNDALHMNLSKRTLSPRISQKGDDSNIYSDRFWSTKLRQHRSTQTKNYSPCCRDIGKLKENSPSKQFLRSRNTCHSPQTSLSRVQSVKSLNSTNNTNMYTYRKIYR